MYSSTGTSAACDTIPHSIGFQLPLDLELQARSLHPLGSLQFNKAYGDLTLDKTRRTLSLQSSVNSDNPEHKDNDRLKLEALSQLQEILSHPQKITLALEQGLFAELVLNSSDSNPAIRTSATNALAALTANRAGRDFAIQADILQRLSRLSSPAEEDHASVRLNVLKTIKNIVSSAAGIRHLIGRGVQKLLVERVAQEGDLTCRSLTLEILSEILRDSNGYPAVMEVGEPAEEGNPRRNGAVLIVAKVLTDMLHDAQTIQGTDAVVAAEGVVSTELKPRFRTIEFLCKVVAHISTVTLAGKNDCVKAEIVPLLVSILQHPVVAIRVQSSLAMQNLTNAESGKLASLDAQALSVLLECGLKDSEEMVQAHALQALTNLVEHPTAKRDERVAEALDTIRKVAETHQSAKVKHAAKLAVEQITWKP